MTIMNELDIKKAVAAGTVAYGANKYMQNRDLTKHAAAAAAASLAADVAGAYVGGAHNRGVKIITSAAVYYAAVRQMKLDQGYSPSVVKTLLLGAGCEIGAGALKQTVERMTGMSPSQVTPHTISNYIGASADLV